LAFAFFQNSLFDQQGQLNLIKKMSGGKKPGFPGFFHAQKAEKGASRRDGFGRMSSVSFRSAQEKQDSNRRKRQNRIWWQRAVRNHGLFLSQARPTEKSVGFFYLERKI